MLLDPSDLGSLDLKQKFEVECDRLKSLSHGCIVKYIDTLTDPETVLIMELYGESLTKFLEQYLTKPLPPCGAQYQPQHCPSP
jgi:serine/threonine protein kinase